MARWFSGFFDQRIRMRAVAVEPGVGALDDPAAGAEASLASKRLLFFAAWSGYARVKPNSCASSRTRCCRRRASRQRPCGCSSVGAGRSIGIDSSVGRARRWSLRLAPSSAIPTGTPLPSVRSDRFAPFSLYRWDWGRCGCHQAAPSSSRRPSPATPTRSLYARRRRADRAATTRRTHQPVPTPGSVDAPSSTSRSRSRSRHSTDMPVRNTNRIAFIASRSGTRGLWHPSGCAGRSGNNGSSSSHNQSGIRQPSSLTTSPITPSLVEVQQRGRTSTPAIGSLPTETGSKTPT